MTSRRATAATGATAVCRRRAAAAPPARLRSDRGSETVEIVILLPALMLLLTVGMQLALWGLAAHAMSLAVAEGGAEARAESGSPKAAISTVTDEISSIAGLLVDHVSVQVTGLPDNFVEVSATADVPTIFPGLTLQVSADSTGPVQAFRPSG